MIARTTHVLFEVLIASLICVGLFSGFAAWRLSKGPISIGFLASDIEDALNGRAGPVHFKLGDTLLAWASWKRALDVRAVDVLMTGEDGAVIAHIPEMSVSFSALALLRGVIAPTSLDILRPRVVIVRESTGRLAFSLEQTGSARGDVSNAILTFMNRKPRQEGGLSSLRRISVLDARLTFDDRYTGIVWHAPVSNIVLLRDGEGVQASIAVTFGDNEGGARFTANGEWKKGQPYVSLDADITGLRVDRIARRIPGAELAQGIGLSLDGRIGARLNLHGEVETAKFALRSGAGVMKTDTLWPNGIPVRRLSVTGRYEADPGFLHIDSFDMDMNGPSMRGQIAAVTAGQDIAIEGSAELHGMPVSEIGTYWPSAVSRSARKWVTKHMSGGVLNDMRVGFSLHVPHADFGHVGVDSLSGQFRVDHTTVHYLDGMPPIQQVSASAVFSPSRLIITLREGEAEGLQIRSGMVRLNGLGGDNERAEIDLRIAGSLPATLRMIDHPRLGYAKKVGIDPRQASGRAVTNLSLRFPLVDSVRLDDLDVAATAQLAGVGVPRVARGQDLSDGAFTLKVDRSRLELAGTGRIGGVEAKLNWTESFDADQAVARKYNVTAVLDEAAQTRFGVPAASYVSGPIALGLAISELRNRMTKIDAIVGLKDADVAIPGLPWRKEPGAAGVLRMQVETMPGKAPLVRAFDLQTAELKASGTARFDFADRLASVRFDALRFGATGLTGTVTRQGENGFDVALQGTALDIRPFIASARRRGPSADLPPFTVHGAVDQLWLGEGEPLHQVSGSVRFVGGEPVSAALSAKVAEGHRASFALRTIDGQRRATLATNSGGETLHALGLFNTMRGGKLFMQAARPIGKADAAWEGSVAVDQFTIINAPVLARMLAQAAPADENSKSESRAVKFARLEIPFSYANGKAEVRNARAVGSELGLTASGVIDLTGETIDLGGTIVPAYTINSVLGNIPVLGRIFTGAKGSGVFAATYTMKGPMASPKVSVNPLAALAPGFLRELVGIIDGSRKIGIDADQELPGGD